MTTEHAYWLALDMERDGCAHGLTLACVLSGLSKVFGADMVEAVNQRRMSWDEVILALWVAVHAPADVYA